MKKAIKFSAVWCPPCRALVPIWIDIAQEKEFKDIEFQTVDTDHSPELAQKYSVQSLPTIVFIKDDAVVDTLVGLAKPDVIREKLRSM
jgi:thioredoxin 1